MNTCSTSARHQREVDVLLTRGLPPPEHSALRDHLRGCPSCRAYYNEARRLEEELSGAPGLSAAAVERLSELVVAEVAPAPARPERAGLVRPLAWLGALTAALLVVVLVPRRDEELTPRGVRAPLGRGALSVFVIVDGGREVRRLGRDPGGSALARGSVVQLAYSNEGFARAVVVGVDERWGVHWYHLGDGDRGVSLVARAHDEPFGQAWSIDAEPGAVRLFAVFGELEPPSRASVEHAVQRAKERKMSVRELERLPGLDAHQDSVLLEVQP